MLSKKMTCDAISDDKVGSMITHFQCMILLITYCSCHINMFTATSPGIIEMHNYMWLFQLKKASKVSCGLTEDNLFEFFTKQINNHITVIKWIVKLSNIAPLYHIWLQSMPNGIPGCHTWPIYHNFHKSHWVVYMFNTINLQQKVHLSYSLVPF